MATEPMTLPVEVVACIRKAVDDWKMHYDAADDGPTMPEFIAIRLSVEGLLRRPPMPNTPWPR